MGPWQRRGGRNTTRRDADSGPTLCGEAIASAWRVTRSGVTAHNEGSDDVRVSPARRPNRKFHPYAVPEIRRHGPYTSNARSRWQ